MLMWFYRESSVAVNYRPLLSTAGHVDICSGCDLGTVTCGKFWLSCLCNESLSFSKSFTLPSRSPVFSCSFFSESTSLSRSSSIETISCSKLASSPNWEERWEIESSEMVGITSHIMFHMARLHFTGQASKHSEYGWHCCTWSRNYVTPVGISDILHIGSSYNECPFHFWSFWKYRLWKENLYFAFTFNQIIIVSKV